VVKASKEWQTKCNHLIEEIIKTDKQGSAIHGLLAAEFYLVKEFVKGSNTDKCTSLQMEHTFAGGDGDEHHLTPMCMQRLKELATLLALDVLTNYCDRLPFIWDNPGNSGNLMVTSAGQS